MGSGFADQIADEFTFVAVEIVHDDDVTRLDCLQQDLRDIVFEAVAVDGSADGERSCHAVEAQGSNKGYGFPAASSHLCHEGFAFLEPAPEPGHVGFDPCFVDKNQSRRLNARLVFAPPVTPSGDVGPVLFGGVNGFF